MNEIEAGETVRELVRELREARETLEDAQRRVVGLRKLIEGYIELYPLLDAILAEEGADEDDSERPRGMDAVAQALTTRPDEWMSVMDTVELLNRLGWLPRSSNPPNAVRTALERLVEQDPERYEKSKTDSGGVRYRLDTSAYGEWGKEPF
jgi:hypothetical protein